MIKTSGPLYLQLLNWHYDRHQYTGTNIPSVESAVLLEKLTRDILLPLTTKFGVIKITYGFTSPELARYIQRVSPQGTAPQLDQHACTEVNTKGKHICSRPGAACDFIVQGYEERMHEVAQFICQQLSFDRLYFYGRNRPIHISVSDASLGHLQLIQQSANGKRYPGKKAFGDKALALAQEL